MKNRSRHLLLVAFVATALAADRVAAAAPQQKPEVTQSVARRLAGRLVITLRQNVPSFTSRPFRQELVRTPAPAKPRFVAEPARPLPHYESSPFEYRLPPPLA